MVSAYLDVLDSNAAAWTHGIEALMLSQCKSEMLAIRSGWDMAQCQLLTLWKSSSRTLRSVLLL